MKNPHRHIFIHLILLFLIACSSNVKITSKQDVLFVVNGYEHALKTNDSIKAITYLHINLIIERYKDEANYHRTMKNAFAAIKRDGGIIRTEKWNLIIKENKASVQSRIVTKRAQQEGILKLEKINNQWVIVEIP